MLEEGVRRAGRGADVVIGMLDDTGRADTGRDGIAALAAGLERAPATRGQRNVPELDVTALRHRRPQVVLVDDLAHRVDEQIGRWNAVEELLSDGMLRAILNPEYAIISTPTAPVQPEHHDASKRTDRRAGMVTAKPAQ
jgi:hypothetical protein